MCSIFSGNRCPCGEYCTNKRFQKVRTFYSSQFIVSGHCSNVQLCSKKNLYKSLTLPLFLQKQYADVEAFVTDWKGMGLRATAALQP